MADVVVISGSEAIAEARLKEPPKHFSLYAMVLYVCAFVGFFCSTCNGFDGSVFNALLLNKAFKAYFNVEEDGAWTGIVSSMYQIGGVVAIPFIGPACDTWGRRFGMMIGGAIGCAGVVIQATAKPGSGAAGQFMGGRFLLGFAVPILTTAGPLHVIETAHPAHRGVITGLYNTFWFVGSILAAGVARGSTSLPGNQSWIMPVWLQILFPGLVAILAWFLPESPRWLYTRGKYSEAKKALTRFHGEGNPDSVWVTMQLREYEEYLDMDGGDKRWWDYRALFKTRGARYRIACNVTVAVFGQWAGNGVIDYFMAGVLKTVGITDEVQGMNINLGKACAQLAFVSSLVLHLQGVYQLIFLGCYWCLLCRQDRSPTHVDGCIWKCCFHVGRCHRMCFGKRQDWKPCRRKGFHRLHLPLQLRLRLRCHANSSPVPC